MVNRINSNDELHITSSIIATYRLILEKDVQSMNCNPSYDYSEFVGNFDQSIFDDDYARFRKAWEELADL